VAAVALVLDGDHATRRERRQRGKDVGELCLDVDVECGDQVRVDAPGVLVQRVHEDGERQLSLELRRRAREDEGPPPLSASPELRQQTRLPDPWLACQLECYGSAVVELVEQLLERGELVGAPYERRRADALAPLTTLRHAASFGR